VIEPRGDAVKQVMHKADERLAFGGLQAGHEGMHGLIFVKEALQRNAAKKTRKGACAIRSGRAAAPS
jgi:hypothetical protein